MIRIALKFFLALILIGVGCVTYGLLIEPKTIELRGPEFLSNKYSGPPLRIGIMTDIHIGGLHVPASRVEKLVADMNALEPDIVLLPGDFVDGHVPSNKRSSAFNTNLEAGIRHLAALKAPSFATIGNHDAWYGANEITNMLKSSGVTVLENDSTIFQDLCIVGLADAMTASPSRAAYDKCPSTTQPIAFTHSPEAWPAFRSDSLLAVAGHTHGGQVNLPIIGRRVNATSLDAEHSYGFSKLAGVNVFVSAGVGTSILPVRFRAPPEIVVLPLRASD
jgi:predicted MPP superfamily phosphohydrolase